MAVVARRCGVCSRQREPVHVLVDLLDRDLPSADRVARLAGRAHLALVDVRMTVRALAAHVREHHFDVAGGASYAFVHAA